jgi:hypothetical protein
MPYLVRIHPTDLGTRFDSRIVEFCKDVRITPGNFIMLVKGNATKGLNDGTQETAQTEA